jgi:hypothetical protein
MAEPNKKRGSDALDDNNNNNNNNKKQKTTSNEIQNTHSFGLDCSGAISVSHRHWLDLSRDQHSLSLQYELLKHLGRSLAQNKPIDVCVLTHESNGKFIRDILAKNNIKITGDVSKTEATYTPIDDYTYILRACDTGDKRTCLTFKIGVCYVAQTSQPQENPRAYEQIFGFVSEYRSNLNNLYILKIKKELECEIFRFLFISLIWDGKSNLYLHENESYILYVQDILKKYNIKLMGSIEVVKSKFRLGKRYKYLYELNELGEEHTCLHFKIEI